MEIEVTKTYQDMEAKYLSATEKSEKSKSLLDKIKEQYDNVMEQNEKLVIDVKHCINRLKEIALKPNPISEIEYINILIENEKEGRKDGYKERVKILEELRAKAEIRATIIKDPNAQIMPPSTSDLPAGQSKQHIPNTTALESLEQELLEEPPEICGNSANIVKDPNAPVMRSNARDIHVAQTEQDFPDPIYHDSVHLRILEEQHAKAKIPAKKIYDPYVPKIPPYVSDKPFTQAKQNFPSSTSLNSLDQSRRDSTCCIL